LNKEFGDPASERLFNEYRGYFVAQKEWRTSATEAAKVTPVGYASSSDLPVHFGIGSCMRADQVELEWPSGSRQVVKDIQADRYVTLREHL